MEKQTYKIVNLPGLSGLYVVGTKISADDDLVEIQELVNVGIVVGDRQLRYPIPPGAMWIGSDFLDESDDIGSREFSTDNPYGEFKYEGRFERDRLVIVHAVYEKAISITIYEMVNDKKSSFQKTL